MLLWVSIRSIEGWVEKEIIKKTIFSVIWKDCNRTTFRGEINSYSLELIIGVAIYTFGLQGFLFKKTCLCIWVHHLGVFSEKPLFFACITSSSFNLTWKSCISNGHGYTCMIFYCGYLSSTLTQSIFYPYKHKGWLICLSFETLQATDLPFVPCMLKWRCWFLPSIFASKEVDFWL